MNLKKKDLIEAAQNFAEALKKSSLENELAFLKLTKIAMEKKEELKVQLSKNDETNAVEKLEEIQKIWSDAKKFKNKATQEKTEALRLMEEALELRKELKLEEQ